MQSFYTSSRRGSADLHQWQPFAIGQGYGIILSDRQACRVRHDWQMRGQSTASYGSPSRERAAAAIVKSAPTTAPSSKRTCLLRRRAALSLRGAEPSQPLPPYNPKLTTSNQHQPRGRVLAMDVGKKRIGLAVSDELGITAQGIETLQRSRIRDDLEELKRIVHHWSVHTLLIGKPLHMSGSESRQSEYTVEFAERLSRYLGLPVVFWDERLTSAEAERSLRETGASLEQRKKAVDRIAAVLLLESYLEYQRNARSLEEESFLG